MTAFPGFSKETAERIASAPFFKETLRSRGILECELSDRRSIDEFTPIDRETLQARLSDLISVDPGDPFQEIWSSGTRGRPIRVVRGLQDEIRFWKIVSRFHPIGPHFRVLFLCTLPYGPEYETRRSMGPYEIETKRMSLNGSRAIAYENLRDSRWNLLSGSPELLRLLTSDSMEQAIEIAPRFLYSTALPLPRELALCAEDRLGIQILHTYSSTETGPIAWQCSLSRREYHVFDDVLVENSGEELLITKLYPSSLPLVRYRIGDLGSVSPIECACGHNGASIQGLQGRKNTVPS